MILFSIALVVIMSEIMIATGYVMPYIILWHYTVKRKTTIKPLILLIEKYGDLTDAFTLSKFFGYAVSGIFSMAAFLDFVTYHHLLFDETLLFGIIYLILTIGLQLIFVGHEIKACINISDDGIYNQSIKI